MAALLGVAELLADYDGPYRVELIPMNGEDYYASSGEHLFVAANEGAGMRSLGTVNMDAIGAKGASTAAVDVRRQRTRRRAHRPRRAPAPHGLAG